MRICSAVVVAQLERSPRMWNVGFSNPGRDRLKLLKTDLVAAPLPNARQQV